MDPGALAREAWGNSVETDRPEAFTVNRIAPASRATSRTVRCGCDTDGALHVSAPQGAQVSIPEDATQPSEAQIVLADEDVQRPGTPLRKTKSLGFIGDNKLTQLPPRGGPWDVPDALLPPHQHVETRYPQYGGYYGYRPSRPHGYGYAPARQYAPAGQAPVGHSHSAPPSWSSGRGSATVYTSRSSGGGMPSHSSGGHSSGGHSSHARGWR